MRGRRGTSLARGQFSAKEGRSEREEIQEGASADTTRGSSDSAAAEYDSEQNVGRGDQGFIQAGTYISSMFFCIIACGIQLEQARIAHSTSEPLPSLPAQSESFPTEFQRDSNPVQAPDVQSNIPLSRPRQLKTHTYQIYSNLAPSVTWSLSSKPLPLPSSSVVPVPCRVDHHLNQHPSHSNPNPIVAEPGHSFPDDQGHSHGHSQSAPHLDHQIAELSAKIGAFKAERDALWQTIASQHAVGISSVHL